MPEHTELARQLAREAGKIIRDSLPLKKEISHKAAVDLVTDVDLKAEKIIVEGIANDSNKIGCCRRRSKI
jgi:fructose-1,6-bisphosphatase/inositol monophosphatase family enzyme